jgi:hypothetical protein
MTDFEKLMAGIGSLMLHWGFLETALDDDIRRRRKEREAPDPARKPGTFGDRMKEWSDLAGATPAVRALTEEIARVRDIRNRVAHGLAGANAKPEDGEPHIWCVDRADPNGGKRRITLTELTQAIDAAEACRNRLRRLTTDPPAAA